MAQYTSKHSKRGPGRARRTRFLPAALSAWLLIAHQVPAQEAGQLEALLGAEAVQTAELAELLTAAGVDLSATGPDTARDPAPVTADELADVIVQLGQFPRSLGYRLLPGPRYAIRMLRDEQRFPADPLALPAGSVPDGRTLLQLLREPLSAAIRAGGGAPAVSLRPRLAPTREQGPWLEWDLEQRIASTSSDGTDIAASASTRLDARLSIGRILDAEARTELDMSDVDEPELQLSEAVALLRLSPEAARRDLRLALGRLTAGALVQDGVGLNARGPVGEAQISVGYRGLLPTSLGGNAALPVEGEDTFSGVASLTALELFGRQNPTLSLRGITDQQSSFRLLEAEAALSGPLARRVFYNAAGIYQFGDGGSALDRSFRGWSASSSLRWFPRSRVPLRLSTELLAASGGAEGEGLTGAAEGSGVFRGYVPLSDSTPWSLYGGQLTNVGMARLTADIRPVERVIARLDALYLVQLTDGATGDAVTNADSASGPALGMELGSALEIEVVPDLIFDLNSRIFVPVADGEDPSWQAGLGLRARL